jgi:hypothetical protein
MDKGNGVPLSETMARVGDDRLRRTVERHQGTECPIRRAAQRELTMRFLMAWPATSAVASGPVR